MEQLRAGDPRQIGAYRLLGRLGTGGMGHVYLARSARGRTVAVKLVRAELAAQEEFRGRFRREVRAALRVGGTWTAPVLDADTEAEVPWLATGYVAGPSLRQVVRDYGPLPERSVAVLAAGLAHALADIHTAGLVHRDLKPSNVMITIDGPRVIDFGIARALETVADSTGTLTHTGAMVGSPAFMSPEQVRGDRVTPACDVFCLGSVLAYAATGLQPFGAASSGVHAQMFRIVQEPPDLTAVPAGLRDLVAACLAKEPAARPSLPDVLRLAADLPGPPAPQESDATRAEPWLPAPIVAQLGRQAVRLLELEAAADDSEEGPEPVTGTGGTPPGADGTAVRGTPAGADLTGPTTPWPAAVPPDPRTYASGSVPGAMVPPAASRRRGRAALVAVLALLAVVAGGATAYVVANQGDDTPRSGEGSHGGTTGTAPRTAAPAVPVSPPEGLVGTWKASYETVPGLTDTRSLTVRADGTVTLTGRRTNGKAALYDCVWTMAVTAAGPPVALSPSRVTSGRPAGSCSPGDATTLTLLDGTHLRRDGVRGEQTPPTYEKTG